MRQLATCPLVDNLEKAVLRIEVVLYKAHVAGLGLVCGSILDFSISALSTLKRGCQITFPYSKWGLTIAIQIIGTVI